MTSTASFRVAFVGCGRISTNHFEAIARIEGLSLAGSTLTGCRTAVLLHDASAALAGAVFSGNTLDVQQQACATVDLPTGLDDSTTRALCPDRWQLIAPLWYGLYLQDVSADP